MEHTPFTNQLFRGWLKLSMLVTTLIESSNQQRFFGEHLPRLTNTSPIHDTFEQFALDLVIKTLAIHEL
jgi:hypothetical protein